MPTNDASGEIQHVFVLMLENRSFDHMLGFSGITGTDAETGQPTQLEGLSGSESNVGNGIACPVVRGADWVMPVDPKHEFPDVVTQLGGNDATYPTNGAYPPVKCSGFADDYFFNAHGNDPGEIMKCYDPVQLPVLVQLAREFAVCDNWFSSLPGPTWPNRYFVHAASSGGLDHSPTSAEIALWETLSGFQFEAGTIFDRLDTLNTSHAWRIYSGGDFPNVAALRGIHNFEIRDLKNFAHDVASSHYASLYTFIEPDYGDVVAGTFKNGNSQHPMDDVTHGEALIKSVYEAIRNSPLWPNSLLVITYDEHGGFYDHVAPPAAVSPGDQVMTNGANQYNFTFTQYGVRVPAVVVSPLIPKNTIDHRLYDHASIPATLEALFEMDSLTQRDAQANNLTALATLDTPRTDAPLTLANPANSSLPVPGAAPPAATTMMAKVEVAPTAAASAPLPAPAPGAPPGGGGSPNDSIDGGNLPGFLHAALRSDLDLSDPSEAPAILAHFQTIKTRAQALDYLNEVRVKVRAGRTSIQQKSARQAEQPAQ